MNAPTFLAAGVIAGGLAIVVLSVVLRRTAERLKTEANRADRAARELLGHMEHHAPVAHCAWCPPVDPTRGTPS